MKKAITIPKRSTLLLLVAALLATGPAFADRDDDHGHGRDKHEERGRGDDNDHRGDRDDQRGHFFQDRQRMAVHDYYSNHYHGGRCPPGLAKKDNGCTPPGHDRRWAVGQPLPSDVVYYPVPPAVVVQLGPPPPNHRYVRVAGDILLIAAGTGMVVDAIQDLGGM